MRNFRRISWQLAITMVATMLIASPATPASASTPSVTAPSAPRFAQGVASQDPGDFVIANFGATATLSVSIGFVDPPAGTSFALSTTTGLTAASGYTLTGDKTQLTFTSTQANANAALAGMTVTTGVSTGDVTIRVTASVDRTNTYYNPINGNYYEYFSDSVYAYSSANTAQSAFHLAETKTLYGVTGFLATVTSAQEQKFIYENFPTSNVWLGATDDWQVLNERCAPTISNKALTSNVATLTTSGQHAIEVGDSITVAAVDDTFNGTYTITAATSTTFSYAKTAGDIASTAVTPTGTSAKFANQTSSEGSWTWVAGPASEKCTRFSQGLYNTLLWINSSTGATQARESGNVSTSRYENWCNGNSSPYTLTAGRSYGEPNGNATASNNGEQFLLEKWSGASCWNDWGRIDDGSQTYLVEYQGTFSGGLTATATVTGTVDVLSPTFSAATTKTTSAGPYTFTVTFGVDVTGVELGDFEDAGSGSSCTYAVTSVSTKVYTLTASSCFSGDNVGTVIPRLKASSVSGNSTTGPISAVTSTVSVTRDRTAPTVSSFSSTTSDGTYKAGGTINITATTDESVQSGNTITVTLDTGATVVLTAASASASLTGNYTVAAGQTSADLTVSSFTIGTVADTAGNAMTSTTVPSGANNVAGAKAIVIDTTAPTATLGVPDLASASDTGVSSTDDITSDDTPTLSVVVTNLEAGGTGYVKASKTGSSDVTCTLSAGSCTLGALAQGTWSIVSYQNDAVGNDGSTSNASSALSITVFTAAPTTATLAASAATSSSATITYTVTGSHQLDCTSLSTTATTTTGTDFVLTAGISAISSIAQTSTTVCTVTATSTATAGGGAVVSTLTAAASFSVSDPAGNARTTLTGSPQSITVTVPAPPSSGGGGGGSSATTTTTAPTTTTTTVPPATTVPKTEVTTTTTPPSRPRLSVPGVAAPKNLTILTPQQQVDSTKIVAEYLQTLERQNESPAANKLRTAVAAAAPALGAAIAEAVTRLAKTLEDKNSTQLEIVSAKVAVADASAKTILIALDATNGNTKSLALPVTKAGKLPDLNPGKALIISPTSSESGKLSVVANTTVVLSSPKENLSLAMTAIDTTGEKVPINKNNSINVDHGQSLAMTGSGFKPNSEVKVWIFSNPRSIGNVITDVNGSFAAEVLLPDNIVPGEHTAQVNGNNKSGGMRSLNLGLEVDLPAETPEAKPKEPSIARSTNIYFRGDDSKLFWGAVSQLKKLLPKLRKARTVEVIGYSHSKTGDNNQFNIELSKTRAENVAAWLRQRKIGVVSVEQFGYDKRFARTRPRLNRRVEIRWSD